LEGLTHISRTVKEADAMNMFGPLVTHNIILNLSGGISELYNPNDLSTALQMLQKVLA
jgi:hypothetical protein